MLKIDGLNVTRGRTHVLHDINMRVNRNEMVALIGANGAGKTTLLHSISALLPARSGSIAYTPDDGRPPLECTKSPAEKIVASGLCHCPEGRGVFAGLSVYENLMMGAYLRRDRHGIAEDMENIYDLFPILGRRKNMAAGKLSGGEQMMLALGRALMGRPRLLILDEPSLGLAPLVVESIFELLVSINVKNVTILLVEQNAVAALEITHRAYVLEQGRIVMEGASKDLMGNDAIKKAYLGG